jgi:hypothetical protein
VVRMMRGPRPRTGGSGLAGGGAGPALLAGVLAAVVGAGCAGRPPRVAVPAIDPDRAATALVARADKDGDGGVSSSESAEIPGIRRAFPQYDADSDGRLSAAEIAGRIRRWQDTRVGRVSCSFVVTLAGKPLPDATVRLVPEPEFEGPLPPASGRTDAAGRVAPRSEGELPGVAPGLYRVSVEHHRLATLPPEAAVSGLQVAPDDPNLASLVVELGAAAR